MNTIAEWNPWSMLDALLGVNNRAVSNLCKRAAGRFPPVNVYLDDNAALIDVELPGKTAKDVDLTVESQAVLLADKPAATVAEDGAQVVAKPAWSRRIELPFRVDHAKANAKFENGVLRVELPRADAVASHRIKIA